MKRLVLFIPLLLFAACEMLVDVEIPAKAPQMVVNVLARTDSTWLADISVSENALDDLSNFDSVTNASVVIADETTGQSIILNHTRSGRYRANSFPVAGHTYSIEVQAEGFETIRATTKAPEYTVIKNVVWDSTRRIKHRDGGHDIDVTPFDVIFDDPGGVKNTYRTDFYEHYVSKHPDPNDPDVIVIDSGKSFVPTYITDPGLVIKNDFYDTDTYPNRFTDDSFDGTEKTLTLLVRDFGFSNENRHRVGIRIASENEDYSRYVDGRNLQREVERNPFAQPAPVHSNFSNTFGIFAVRTFTEFELMKKP